MFALRSHALTLCVAALALAALLAAAAATGASAVNFAPVSVTFISPQDGWVIGTAPCGPGSRCVALRSTGDSGRSWVARPVPAGLAGQARNLAAPAQLNVRFADRENGWIYGDVYNGSRSALNAELWSTHDGGATWVKQNVAGLGKPNSWIFDLEASGGLVHLIERNSNFTVGVETSPVGDDRWRPSGAVRLEEPAGGGQPAAALVLAGSQGWLVEGNDRGTTGSARLSGGRWVAWTPPCASVGHSFAIPAASSASDLIAVCVMGGFAYPLSKDAPKGATLGSSWLYSSADGGASFHAGPRLGGHAFGALLVATPRPGVVLLSEIGSAGRGQTIDASFDGGRTFTTVYRSASVVYLAFTDQSQGVAIVGPAAHTQLLMTFDGGRRWSAVTLGA
ncbi:MAG TPA: hypothetical protein VKS25_03950 [Solirubrobacteraceae bacterium]|nr:hypothetical protein [Solirubrobacteraceae bacterium]